MADYSSYYSCGCSTYGSHSLGCVNNQYYDWHKNGTDNNMTPVYTDYFASSSQRPLHYKCNNGCGCLVFDVDDHMSFAHGYKKVNK